MKYFIYIIAGFLLSSGVFAHGMSDADKQKILDAGHLQYFELGASHMLSGYDHLLFLFGVIFFLTKFKDIVKFITAFTLGHSITLVFATVYTIQANYFLIDAVIALTVIYKGFDNLDGFKKYLNTVSPNLLLMVFTFGLIHGFGLSTRLQQLPLPKEGLILKILSFNVGVEVGQVFALTAMLLILAGWRKTKSFQRFSNAMNFGLILLGSLLFLMQLHGFSHTAFPDDFPLNRDDHYHAHNEAESPDPLRNYKKNILNEENTHQHGSDKPHAH
ncbi:HupE/UreJ family protein [Leptospira idonii]|uniref:HupE/UreJ family protein n=1 Tax=Leptospira idonii TaxID=1193500 RepID=A0A4R9LTJ8_9LEPT|nr:HupE/UreJ family protein [Leptospira idonii]TGN16936.1 HupE/UreJ family protein [Leptospira idonii]